MPDSICPADFFDSALSKKGSGASTKASINAVRCSAVKMPPFTSRSTSLPAMPSCMRKREELPAPPASITWPTKRDSAFGMSLPEGRFATSLAANAMMVSTLRPSLRSLRMALCTWFRRLFSSTRRPRRSNRPGASPRPRSRAPSTGPGARALIWISGPRCRDRISAKTRWPALETA